MRRASILAVAAVCLIAAFVAAHGQSQAPVAPAVISVQPQPIPSTPPDSLVGRAVHVYFRGSDAISYPARADAGAPAGAHVTYLAAHVLSVKPGWIELGDAGPTRPVYWVAASAIAFVASDDGLLPWNPTGAP